MREPRTRLELALEGSRPQRESSVDELLLPLLLSSSSSSSQPTSLSVSSPESASGGGSLYGSCMQAPGLGFRVNYTAHASKMSGRL